MHDQPCSPSDCGHAWQPLFVWVCTVHGSGPLRTTHSRPRDTGVMRMISHARGRIAGMHGDHFLCVGRDTAACAWYRIRSLCAHLVVGHWVSVSITLGDSAHRHFSADRRSHKRGGRRRNAAHGHPGCHGSRREGGGRGDAQGSDEETEHDLSAARKPSVRFPAPAARGRKATRGRMGSH